MKNQSEEDLEVEATFIDGSTMKLKGQFVLSDEEEEFKLEVGKDYIGKCAPTIVIDRKGGDNNFGFSLRGGFLENISCNRLEIWREATKEEVIEALEKECARRLGENWRDAKLKTHASGESIVLNTGDYEPHIEKHDSGGWIVWNKNGCVYYDGKWAEKLEETKFAENLDDIDRPWYPCSDGRISAVYYAHAQDINRVPSKAFAEGLLALAQLLSFRHDVWEKEGKPEGVCWSITITIKGDLEVAKTTNEAFPFSFKTMDTAEWFLKTHKELLIEYFNKLIR